MPKIYESSVETIRETFAVLIGFAVTEFIGDNFQQEGSADITVWVLSLILILLVLRLFIGTANHLKTTYAEIEGGDDHADEFNCTTGFFLKDVGFLIAFGVVSILIAKSDPKAPASFLKRTLLLLLITSLWSILDVLLHWVARVREWFKRSRARSWCRWWLLCDSSQLLLTAIFWRWGLLLPRTWCWSWLRPRGLTLIALFAGFFIADVRKILEMRQSEATGRDERDEPFPWLHVVFCVAAVVGAVAVYRSGTPAWLPDPF